MSVSVRFMADHGVLPLDLPALPPGRDFLVSPGAGGAAVGLAAILVAVVGFFALRGLSKRHREQIEQTERHHQESRDAERHAAAVAECRERLKWVVDKAGIEPASYEGATVGFGPELALAVLEGIVGEAEQLGDSALAKAATVQLSQLSLVLAQQGSALSQFAAAEPSPSTTAPAHAGSAQQAETAPDVAQKASEDGQPAPPTVTVAAEGGRRRRQ